MKNLSYQEILKLLSVLPHVTRAIRASGVVGTGTFLDDNWKCHYFINILLIIRCDDVGSSHGG